ncbi:hypothetical protein [Legionella drancourtii]|uniref:Uncharacterized protein n=1 Tax=Legionella drancourtii LLAP12 TaxID=658187 RepID=G9ETM4_9GAMM|nr:hypothetical protein [Legionella drancourtii]EHL29225.1 hypothetical protein LDG_8659 [Legionella drancourtii LLAP12]
MKDRKRTIPDKEQKTVLPQDKPAKKGMRQLGKLLENRRNKGRGGAA